MTAEERKRGLRAAVEAKVSPYPNFRMLYPAQIELLWEVIDGLVDDASKAPPAEPELAKEVLYILGHYSSVPKEALIHLVLALQRFEANDLPCHLCGKPKGPAPRRCPGHYQEIVGFVKRVARMSRLGDILATEEGEHYPYQPDGCSDEDAQALYGLIDIARGLVRTLERPPVAQPANEEANLEA